MENRKKFIEAYRHLWLYSSDEVIRKVNDFLISLGYSKPVETPQDKAAREMIYAMRKSIYGNTQLFSEDFLIAGVKPYARTRKIPKIDEKKLKQDM